MNSKDNKNKELQNQQADLLDKTYTLGWMDGYTEGYDDAIEDSQDALNQLENENGLLADLIENKDKIIYEIASNAGKSLQAVKKNK
ncbi:hypothetical protein F4826_005027 [Rahnella inusitata]|nr:hypothetical protein [Rahnella inusitata]